MTYRTHDEVFGTAPWLEVGGRALTSRLLLGIEQYTSPELVGQVLDAAGADVFITTFDLEHTRSSLLLMDLDEHVELDRYTWIGTTSFAHSAEAAVETARQLRDRLGLNVIKLDVRDEDNLPDTSGTILAAKQLLSDGFSVLPFVLPERDTVRSLEELGCSAIRLMASPVASYRGIADPAAIERCVGAMTVPAVVEGGLGSPRHVVEAMELGASAVLVNTLVARAPDPVAMAAAVKHALLAGGLSSLARRPLRAVP